MVFAIISLQNKRDARAGRCYHWAQVSQFRIHRIYVSEKFSLADRFQRADTKKWFFYGFIAILNQIFWYANWILIGERFFVFVYSGMKIGKWGVVSNHLTEIAQLDFPINVTALQTNIKTKTTFPRCRAFGCYKKKRTHAIDDP